MLSQNGQVNTLYNREYIHKIKKLIVSHGNN